MIRKALISTPILLLMAGAAAAGDMNKKTEADIRAGVTAETEGGKIMPAPPATSSALALGTKAMSADGEDIGTVVEVVSDTSGEVRSLIVETSGLLLGLGSRSVAIPADKVNVSAQTTVITMTQAEIEKLPDYKG